MIISLRWRLPVPVSRRARENGSVRLYANLIRTFRSRASGSTHTSPPTSFVAPTWLRPRGHHVPSPSAYYLLGAHIVLASVPVLVASPDDDPRRRRRRNSESLCPRARIIARRWYITCRRDTGGPARSHGKVRGEPCAPGPKRNIYRTSHRAATTTWPPRGYLAPFLHHDAPRGPENFDDDKQAENDERVFGWVSLGIGP